MTQNIFGFSMGASGIVGTLVIAGILLSVTGVSAQLGKLAAFGGIFIGLILGLLGAVGVAGKILR